MSPFHLNMVFIVHFCAVGFMTGLIWLIQLVQYPLMARVGNAEFPGYHAAHSFRIGWIVVPVMSTELATAAVLALAGHGWEVKACLALTAGCFVSTALLSVPCHARLSRGFDESAHRRLVFGNWPRTIAWSGHLLLCGWMLVGLFSEQGLN